MAECLILERYPQIRLSESFKVFHSRCWSERWHRHDGNRDIKSPQRYSPSKLSDQWLILLNLPVFEKRESPMSGWFPFINGDVILVVLGLGPNMRSYDATILSMYLRQARNALRWGVVSGLGIRSVWGRTLAWVPFGRFYNVTLVTTMRCFVSQDVP